MARPKKKREPVIVENPHDIFEQHPADMVGKIQLINIANEKLQDFSPASRLADIREIVEKTYGEGHFTLRAMNAETGRPLSGWVKLNINVPPRDDVKPEELYEERPQPMTIPPEILRAHTIALESARELEREILEGAREMADQIVEGAREDAQSTIDRADMRATQITSQAAQDAQDIRSSAQLLLDRADARLAEIEQRAREGDRAIERERDRLRAEQSEFQVKAMKLESEYRQKETESRFDAKLAKLETGPQIPKSIRGEIELMRAEKELNPPLWREMLEEYGEVFLEIVARIFPEQAQQMAQHQASVTQVEEPTPEQRQLSAVEAFDELARLAEEERESAERNGDVSTETLLDQPVDIGPAE